jgi:hypothetical protein
MIQWFFHMTFSAIPWLTMASWGCNIGFCGKVYLRRKIYARIVFYVIHPPTSATVQDSSPCHLRSESCMSNVFHPISSILRLYTSIFTPYCSWSTLLKRTWKWQWSLLSALDLCMSIWHPSSNTTLRVAKLRVCKSVMTCTSCLRFVWQCFQW